MRKKLMIKDAYRVHAHTMKQRQFSWQTDFLTQPLLNSHCFVAWVDWIFLENRCCWTQAWKTCQCGLRNLNRQIRWARKIVWCAPCNIQRTLKFCLKNLEVVKVRGQLTTVTFKG
jgi:hypothetical protein